MGPVSARPQFISRPVELDTNQLDKAEFEVLIFPVGVWEQAQPSRKAGRKKQLCEFPQHTPANGIIEANQVDKLSNVEFHLHKQR